MLERMTLEEKVAQMDVLMGSGMGGLMGELMSSMPQAEKDFVGADIGTLTNNFKCAGERQVLRGITNHYLNRPWLGKSLKTLSAPVLGGVTSEVTLRKSPRGDGAPSTFRESSLLSIVSGNNTKLRKKTTQSAYVDYSLVGSTCKFRHLESIAFLVRWSVACNGPARASNNKLRGYLV